MVHDGPHNERRICCIPIAVGGRLDITHEYKGLDGVGPSLGVYDQKTGDDFARFLAADFKKPAK